MIIGLLLGISLAIGLTSLLIIATSATGILRENIATGAVIGTPQASSYAFLVLIVSLVMILFLILILRKRH